MAATICHPRSGVHVEDAGGFYAARGRRARQVGIHEEGTGIGVLEAGFN